MKKLPQTSPPPPPTNHFAQLFDVLQKLGVKSFGQTTVDDSYVHEESKAQRGDKFVGLMCDQANQDDLTEERVEKWVGQLVEEGFFSGEGSSPPPSPLPPQRQ